MKTALIIFAFAAIGGFGLLVSGVYVLAGFGWALVSGAASLFAIAGFVRKGMVSG